MRRFFYATNNNEYPKLSRLRLVPKHRIDCGHRSSLVPRTAKNIGDQVYVSMALVSIKSQLQSISKKHATATLLAHSTDERSLAYPQPHWSGDEPRRAHADYAIQKSTELGKDGDSIAHQPSWRGQSKTCEQRKKRTGSKWQ